MRYITLFDLPKYLDKSNGISINNLILTHILCADDIVLLADSAKDLQNNLNALLGFCKKWHLIVNVKKTKIMKFNDKSPCGFYYNTEQLEEVDCFKYLGHMLTNKRNLVTQAKKAIFALQGDTKQSLGCITSKLSLKMFDTFILPILEYNNEMWAGEKPINDLEKLQLGYLKNMLGVRKQTSALAVYSETGRFPLHVKQKVRMIN